MGAINETTAARVGTLTDRQRACLRLVLRGYETKEIARLIEVSPDRASKDIKAAMAKLACRGASMPRVHWR
jgi:DNA-binding CsgD family transcriptional regulator